MALKPIKENENFFINGSGTAIITGAHGKMGLIHLQDMELELGSEMEEIFGGEGNFPVFQYQTQKTASVKFTNASMSLDTINSTQGVTAEKNVVLFQNELVVVGADGSLPLTYLDTADLKTLTVYGDNDNIIEVTDGKIDSSYAGKRVGAVYAYTTTTGAIGSSVKTTSVPGYVQIFHKSNPIKQKNGRIVRLYTTIYRARCDGSLTITQEHDGAYAPELNFELVDPEREDGKFISFAVKDVTDGEGEEVVAAEDDTDIQKDYDVLPDVDKAADAPTTGGETTGGDTTGGDTTDPDTP